MSSRGQNHQHLARTAPHVGLAQRKTVWAWERDRCGQVALDRGTLLLLPLVLNDFMDLFIYPHKGQEAGAINITLDRQGSQEVTQPGTELGLDSRQSGSTTHMSDHSTTLPQGCCTPSSWQQIRGGETATPFF